MLKPRVDGAPRAILLAETPPSADGTPLVAKFIGNLSDSGQCALTSTPGLMQCVGTKDKGRVRIVFSLLPDSSGGFQSTPLGVPIHARCEGTDQARVGCTVDNYLRNGVRVRTIVDPDKITPEEIMHLHSASVEIVERAYDR